MERRLMSTQEVEQEIEKGGTGGWASNGKALTRRFEFKNFSDALSFVNRVGEIADAADHHPDIKLGWGYAEFEITTHDRGGITDVDFALAKKISELSDEEK